MKQITRTDYINWNNTNFHQPRVYVEYKETQEWIIQQKVSVQSCIMNWEVIPQEVGDFAVHTLVSSFCGCTKTFL